MTTNARGRTVYLHIGAPKSGSTFIQGVLWANREALQSVGVGLPGVGAFEHYRASKDLRGVPFHEDEPGGEGTGTWDTLARKVAQRGEQVVVLSDEQLAAVTSGDVERVVSSLAPRDVHVVYVVRELSTLLPSAWQEVVKHRGRRPYEQWAKGVLRRPDHPFWRLHYVPEVLERWGSVVPSTQIHVVTMPPPTSGPDELWRRFASVLGVDPSVATEREVAGNPSLGPAETEVLRQLNEQLPPAFDRWHYTTLARDLVVSQIFAGSGSGAAAAPAVSTRLAALVVEKARDIAAGIDQSGCEVVGALSDLEPATVPGSTSRPADAELLAVAVRGMAGLLTELARRQDESRRSKSTRLLEAAVRQKSFGRLVAAAEGRSARLDDMLADRAGRTRARLRKPPQP